MKGFNFVLWCVLLALLSGLFVGNAEASGFRFRQNQRQQQRAFNQGFHAAQRLQHQQQLQLQFRFHR